MMPRRIRWLAPRALPAASVPARPVATLPMKLRRDCMGIGSLDVNQLYTVGVGGGWVRVCGGQVVSFCSGWEEKWVRLVFLFSATGWGVLGVRHGDIPPTEI